MRLCVLLALSFCSHSSSHDSCGIQACKSKDRKNRKKIVGELSSSWMDRYLVIQRKYQQALDAGLALAVISDVCAVDDDMIELFMSNEWDDHTTTEMGGPAGLGVVLTRLEKYFEG